MLNQKLCIAQKARKVSHNVGSSFYRFSDAFKTKLIEQIYLIANTAIYAVFS